MSRIFDLIKNLFGGISSFLGGLFGSKQLQESPSGATSSNESPKARKSRGYYLELDDARGVTTAEPAKKEPVQQPPVKAESPASAKPVEPVAAVATATPAKAAPAKTAAPAKPEPVKAAEPKPASNPLNLPQPTVTTFAPNYLTPTPDRNGRRRPGANMNYFPRHGSPSKDF